MDHLYPTDIDAMIEYKDSKYIIFEVKYADNIVPYAQRMALERMADDFTKAGKQVAVLICRHYVSDPRHPVELARCSVSEVYNGRGGAWREPVKRMNVKEAIGRFQKGERI